MTVAPAHRTGRRVLAAALLGLSFALAGCERAPAPSPRPASVADRASAYLEPLGQQRRFSGSILIARGGVRLLSRGYGMADWEQGIPNTPETQFALASVTKPFTATGILILEARGRLDVQDLICRYLPECPIAWRQVTIHHLLTHTSGIRRDFVGSGTWTPSLITAEFKEQPLEFRPGERYRYGNVGYDVLGYIIERVSGLAYADFLRASIFEPLQMTGTGYAGTAFSDHARGYLRIGEAPIAALVPDPSVTYAAGGLHSTVEDLYRWDQALYSESLLPRAALQRMFTPNGGRLFPTLRSALETHYGYGWNLDHLLGHRRAFHTGRDRGFVSYLARHPDDRVTIVVLSNLEDSSRLAAVATHLSEIVLEER